MAAVAVAKLDVLDSPRKQEGLRPNMKFVSRMQSKDEEQKSRAMKSYLKPFEGARNKANKGLIMKKKVNKNIKVKRTTTNEANKKEALESCLKTVEVAKNQLNGELLLQLKKQYHLPLESYESQSLEFLKVPDSQNVNFWFFFEHLKKCYVVVKQMEAESENNNEYHDSLKNTRNQIRQMMERLEITAMLITGKISSKSGLPHLPDELKTESSRSLRQNRDYLFVKEYKNILEVIEEFLKNCVQRNCL